jgi:2',3'-cyclic-nucleotide 2'-phosphodiesterase (5'-nucleotidase family)
MKFSLKIIFLLGLFASACRPTHLFLADEKATRYRVAQSDTIQSDPAIEAMIQPYRAKLDGLMNEVIGQSAKELTYGDGNSPMGNWACDLMLKQATIYYGKKVDFTAINRGGLRIRSLSKGNITRGKIYELMPFDNALLIITIDGTTAEKFIQLMAAKGGWPMAGAKYTLHGGKAEDITIGGEILRGDKTYTLCLSDFIANGGDNVTFFTNSKKEDLNKLMRDAFIEGVIRETKEGHIIDGNVDDRIGKH